MFVVTVTFEIAPNRMKDFLPLMIDNATLSKETEPGCHQFDVCRTADKVFLYEVYESETAFHAHLQTTHFQTFDAKVADMVSTKIVTTFSEVYQ